MDYGDPQGDGARRRRAIQPLVTARSAPLPSGERARQARRALAADRGRRLRAVRPQSGARRRAAAVARPTWLAAWQRRRDRARAGRGSLARRARAAAGSARAPDRTRGRVRRARSWRRRARRASLRCASDRACCAPRRRRLRRSPSCRRRGGIGDDASMRLLAIIAVLAGCATPPPVGDARRGPATYAYVRARRGGTCGRARDHRGGECPTIDLDGVAAPMDVRARPATVPLRPTRSEPADSKPSAFPVLVCEKSIPDGVARAAVDGRALPLPKANPRRIVVLGDTGLPDQDGRPRVPGVQRRRRSGRSPPSPTRGGRDGAGSRHPRRRLPLSRERVSGRQRGMRRQSLGLRLGRVGGRSVRPGARRCSRRRRGSSCAAITSRAIARARAGGDSSTRARSPPRQDCNDAADDAIGDYSEPYAVPLGSGRRRRHAVHRVRFVAGRRRAAGAERPDARQVSRAVRARVRARRAPADARSS